MKKNFKGRDFLSVADLDGQELLFLLDYAAGIKRQHQEGKLERSLRGKGVALIFEKPSTRTRVSFEMGIYLLGGHPVNLSPTEMQLGRGETIEDTGRVLSRYVDAIMIRTFQQETVERLAEAADVPVINGLTDLEHPCQILADLLTVRERKGLYPGLKLTYLGDGNNVANSLLLGCALSGLDICVACPEGYAPDPGVLRKAGELAKSSRVEVTGDPLEAVRGAEVVYTDVWVSMGQKDEEERKRTLQPYQLNSDLLARAAPSAIVMHCLPAHREEEITNEVIDGSQSVVWDQAENRLYAQMALLELLLV
jgi:ornithine carbamoyltransferase